MINCINLVFEKHEMIIIFEDYCFLKSDFFKFCYLLLKKYAKEFEIWKIIGTNFHNENLREDGSLFFSKYFQSCSWATWINHWLMLVNNLPGYQDFKKIAYKKNFYLHKSGEKYRFNIFDNLKYKILSYFLAYSWLNKYKSNKGLSIMLKINLMDKIGFDYEASNTDTKVNRFFTKNKIKLFLKNVLLKNPKIIKINFLADKYTFLNSLKIKLFKKINLVFVDPNYYLKKILKLINF